MVTGGVDGVFKIWNCDFGVDPVCLGVCRTALDWTETTLASCVVVPTYCNTGTGTPVQLWLGWYILFRFDFQAGADEEDEAEASDGKDEGQSAPSDGSTANVSA